MCLLQWVDEIAALCKPDNVYFCDGSDEEFDRIAKEMVQAGSLIALNPSIRPHSFLARSDPDDVARVEENTYICSEKKEEAGPTNHWKDPQEMHAILKKLFNGCMQGRTMYVIPYCMGPLFSPLSRFGVEITDSPYVVLSMKLMARMGKEVQNKMGDQPFIPGVHSVGKPLQKGEKDVPWPCNPANRWIVHFPKERAIWSFGSGYGGNALLGKKCFALRIASCIAHEEGSFAEHMLILKITAPNGVKKYIAAAFPSACGKTNLAMLTPTIPGWKIECVGDDIAWMQFGKDGRLYAINPEAGFFGVAPGTSMKTNPNAMLSLHSNAIFTNVALTPDGDIWWEGIGKEAPKGLISWLGTPYDPKSGKLAAHPNSRFTVAAKQCPIYDEAADHPEGVPISAILFGGRRPSTIPLVFESFHWQHGVLLGAGVSSETTAAAKGEIGKLRHDPFAMLPFCGYNMGTYFSHWLQMGKKSSPEKLPRIYYVNWFRKNDQGQFLWPGFGDNIRVLKWIFERLDGATNAIESPIGYLPKELDLSGLQGIDYNELFKINKEEWLKEYDELERYFKLFEPQFPQELKSELQQLRSRLI